MKTIRMADKQKKAYIKPEHQTIKLDVCHMLADSPNLQYSRNKVDENFDAL